MHEWYEKIGEIEAVKDVTNKFDTVLGLNEELKERQ